MDAWTEDPEVHGSLLGAAVATAAHAADTGRQIGEIEIVASGPRSATLHPRSTEQVLLGLVAEARQELLLITFALEGYDDLRDAIREAVERGVRVRVLAEDPIDAPGFHGNPAIALSGLACERLRWPRDRRPGRGAALHAKVVVVDRAIVFVTSANLTQRASGDNIEMGLLLRGSGAGGRLASHIDQLATRGVLWPG